MLQSFRFFVALFVVAVSSLFPSLCRAVGVVVIADNQLRPVTEIVSGIKKTLKTPIRMYSPAEVKGSLATVVENENAKVVIALGKVALAEALRLPPSVPVIYDLVVVPPVVNRPNTIGFYMATPAHEYTDLIHNYLRSIRKVAVVGSRHQLNLLARGDIPQQNAFGVKNSLEFISTMRQLDSADAIILLPDSALLSNNAMDEAYLISFKKGIPLLGISEQSVKEGALLALVVDTVNVGKLIGEAAARALRYGSLTSMPPSPPHKFDMFLNAGTASRMGINLPNELVRMAKRVYQ
ncbi:ABC transporter substrate-binding protein [Geomesophilobacter sediminis]|uniref:ABC transporter substrate-binding protein n=1 Tax=Geomesophilobacter sediminis TaxID=2798584 RepID=A0A8J7JKQ9_9BACT|nr:ABC transporter substrate binding protein [Geomesophilobacter sediminis]MBJ6725010.1 hypothetical protein [Geomesophilobacter sediminis]